MAATKRKQISLVLPASMGKPWSISEKTGKLRYVKIRKDEGSTTAIFEAANSFALIQTQVDNAFPNPRGRFEICIPAQILQKMRPFRHPEGSPHRFRIDIFPDHRDSYVLVSYGDGMQLKGDLGDNPRLPSFENLLPDIKTEFWEDTATPRRAVDSGLIQNVIGAMTKITRAVHLYLPDSDKDPFVLRKFKEGVGSRSTAVVMPTFVEW